MRVQDRYEFRVWAPSLATFRKDLEARALADGSRASTEIYLLSPTTDNCSAKIRARVLEVKIMLQHRGVLEQWSPVLKKNFPLRTSFIVERLFPLLAANPPPLTKGKYDLNDFLEAVSAGPGGVRVAVVTKDRNRFLLGQCQAEFTRVTLGAITRDTIAVEGADPNAVLAAISALGINDLPNCSYPRQIKLLLGIA